MGGSKNKKVSKETKLKISEKNKLYYSQNPNPMQGKHHSEETKKKISKANKGKFYNTKEHMIKMQRISADRRIGKHLSEKTKNKISKSSYGRKHDKESRAKMSEAQKNIKIERIISGKKHPNYGKICEKSGIAKLTWNVVRNIRLDFSHGIMVKKLVIKYNISQSHIYKILRNKCWIDNKADI